MPTSTSCMGIIIVFNVITEKEEVPQVVLIRALEPLLGLELWLSIEE
ncbi:MAG: DNA-3-methyladenine glycosylase [Methanobacterium sp.]